ECPDAACAQFGISDRPAFFSHPVGTEAAVRSDKIIVLLALADVLRWALVPFRVMVPVCRNRGCLYRGGRQSYQTDQGWDDHSHFSLCLGGTTRQCVGEFIDKRGNSSAAGDSEAPPR